MQANGLNQYEVVVHSPTPAGNNSAGVAWSAVLVNGGNNASSLPIGAGGGRISQNEANQIAAGTVFETKFSWGDDPAWTNPQRIADLELRAQQAVAEALTEFQKRNKFFGHEVA
jgi:hypothetical protein